MKLCRRGRVQFLLAPTEFYWDKECGLESETHTLVEKGQNWILIPHKGIFRLAFDTTEVPHEARLARPLFHRPAKAELFQ